MSSFLKLCLKSILSHSESFETHLFLGENWVGTPILSHFQEFLQEFKLFKGQNFFFPNVTQIWSSTRKTIKSSLSSFLKIGGGRASLKDTNILQSTDTNIILRQMCWYPSHNKMGNRG